MPRKMAKKSSATQARTSNVTQVVAKRTRARTGEVSIRILEALASGPKSRSQLLAAANCSTASLYLHLKALSARQQIMIAGRRAPITLVKPIKNATEPKAQVLPKLLPKAGTELLTAPIYVTGSLHEALEAVAQRFEAPAHIGEKLHTLEQLAKTLPKAIADILTAIHADLLRLSPGRGNPS